MNQHIQLTSSSEEVVFSFVSNQLIDLTFDAIRLNLALAQIPSHSLNFCLSNSLSVAVKVFQDSDKRTDDLIIKQNAAEDQEEPTPIAHEYPAAHQRDSHQNPAESKEDKTERQSRKKSEMMAKVSNDIKKRLRKSQQQVQQIEQETFVTQEQPLEFSEKNKFKYKDDISTEQIDTLRQKIITDELLLQKQEEHRRIEKLKLLERLKEKDVTHNMDVSREPTSLVENGDFLVVRPVPVDRLPSTTYVQGKPLKGTQVNKMPVKAYRIESQDQQTGQIQTNEDLLQKFSVKEGMITTLIVPQQDVVPQIVNRSGKENMKLRHGVSLNETNNKVINLIATGEIYQSEVEGRTQMRKEDLVKIQKSQEKARSLVGSRGSQQPAQGSESTYSLHKVQDSLLTEMSFEKRQQSNRKEQGLPELNDPKLKQRAKLNTVRNSLFDRIKVRNKDAALDMTDSINYEESQYAKYKASQANQSQASESITFYLNKGNNSKNQTKRTTTQDQQFRQKAADLISSDVVSSQGNAPPATATVGLRKDLMGKNGIRELEMEGKKNSIGGSILSKTELVQQSLNMRRVPQV